VKFGTRTAFEILNYAADYYGAGVWEFSTDLPLNPASPATFPFRYTTGSGPETKEYHNTEWGLFAQDDWKVNQRVTTSTPTFAATISSRSSSPIPPSQVCRIW
jgi:hypothetical protein